jgi:hypothetical protein
MTLPMFPDAAPVLPDIRPARRIKGTTSQLLAALGGDFPTETVASLAIGFDGVEGDYHAGHTRKSGGREPWYPRGTEIRNERQISIVAADELAMAAKDMGIDRIEPGWIGANLVIEGIPLLSMLPPRTQLFFEGGVTLQDRWRQRSLQDCRSASRQKFSGYGPDRVGVELRECSQTAPRRCGLGGKAGVALPRVRPLPRGSGSSGSIPGA